MDKDFKKIFDELRNSIERTNKVYRIMMEYQKTLDKEVEEGMISEHEARMAFHVKTEEVLEAFKMDKLEEFDDDAEAESEDGCDNDEDEDFDCAAEKAVSFFVEHKELFDAICEVRKLCDGTPCSVVVRLDFSDDDCE